MAEKQLGGSAMFVEERQRRILTVLQRERRVSVTDLSERFKMSPSTLRNDLRDMEARGLVQRTHGGAVLPESQASDEPVTITGLSACEEKRAIGVRAAEFVHDGEAIFVDNGATAMAFAQALTDKRDLTIVTADLPIATYAGEHLSGCNVIVLGGSLRAGFTFTTGAVALAAAQLMNVSTAFFGATGFTLERGFSVSTPDGAELKRVMLQNSLRRVMMVDSHKFGSNAAVSYATLSEANVLITDTGISDRDRVAIESMVEGPSLVVVS